MAAFLLYKIRVSKGCTKPSLFSPKVTKAVSALCKVLAAKLWADFWHINFYKKCCVAFKHGSCASCRVEMLRKGADAQW